MDSTSQSASDAPRPSHVDVKVNFQKRYILPTALTAVGVLSVFAIIGSTLLNGIQTETTSQAGLTNCQSGVDPIGKLTSCIKDRLNKYTSANPKSKQKLLSELKQLAQKRKTLLLAKVTQKPAEFLADATLAGSTVPQELTTLIEKNFNGTGTYRVTHGDDPANKRALEIISVTMSDKPLLYAVHATSTKQIPPISDTGTVKFVNAVMLDDHIVVNTTSGVFTASTLRPALPEKNSIKVQNTGPGVGARPINVIIMKVKFSDAPDDQLPYANNADLQETVINNVNSYLSETTFGKASLTTTFEGTVQVYPKDDSYYLIDTSNPEPGNPYTQPFNSKTSCAQYSIMGIARKRAIADGAPAKYLDVSAPGYDSSVIRLFVFPDRSANAPADRRSCVWSGLTDSASALPGPVIWLNGHASLYTAAHEAGHAMGLAHAGSIPAGSCYPDCPMPAKYSPEEYTHEYGDRIGIMGYINRHQFNAPNKYILNLYPEPGQIVNIEGNSYNKIQLYPIEHYGPGAHIIRIKRPNPVATPVGTTALTDYYYVELRRPIGVDADIDPALQPFSGILIHKWSGDPSNYFTFKIQTRTIDPSPASLTDQISWGQGQTFTDSINGITIRLDSPPKSSSNSQCDPVRVTVCVGQSSCPVNNDTLPTNVSCVGSTPQPTTPPTQPTPPPVQPTTQPPNQPLTYVTRVSSFHQSIGNVLTGAQKQTFVSDDTGEGFGTVVYFRYLKSDKTWDAWQREAITGNELAIPSHLTTSIRSFSQSKRPSDGLNKQDVLSKDGDIIYSRFWNGSGWGAWGIGAQVADLKLPDGSTKIRAFAQSISPLNGRHKQDFLIGTGERLYSRFWDTTKNSWGPWEVTTQASTVGNGESAIRSFSQGVDPNNIPKQDVLTNSGTDIYYRKFGAVEAGKWPGFTKLPVRDLLIPQ